MSVRVIPEDHLNDQYILKPLFERLFDQLGFANTGVRVCQLRLRGVNEALKSEKIREVIDRYSMDDVFILCVDRDCNENRRDRLDQLEKEFNPRLLAVNAWEEIETWALAELELPNDWRWAEVRAECNVKERFFEPFAELKGVSDRPSGGRDVLGESASRNVRAIRQKCPEDFDVLARRLENLT